MGIEDSNARWRTFLQEQYPQDIHVLTSGWPNPKFLTVKFSAVQAWDPNFAQSIIDFPRPILQAGRDALVDICRQSGHEINPQLRIIELPSYSRKQLRNIGSDDIEHFVSTEAVVTKISELKPRIYHAEFRCVLCMHITPVSQPNELELVEPVLCDQAEGGCNRSVGGKDGTRFDLIQEGIQLVDNQWIEIQELPEQVEAGTPPARATLLAEEDLANVLTPGSRVTVNIIPFIRTQRKRNTKTPMFDIYHSLKSVERDLTALTEIKISEDDIEEIKKISQREDLFEFMRDSIAPSIIGTGMLKAVKLSLIYQLFGGEARKNRDSTRIRGDIHILLVGDPGVAKSQLLKFMGDVTPRGQYATGGGVTGAGLTAAAIKDAFNDGRFSLEAGVLPLSDMGLAAIDEFDKMNPTDRASMHLAMEQQVIHISKGGLHASMRTRCAILAAANPENERWSMRGNPQGNILPYLEEINLDPALLTRFDIIWMLRDDVIRDQDDQIAEHILENRTTGVSEQLIEEGRVEDPAELDQESSFRTDYSGKEMMTVSMLQKYVAYARRFVHPTLSSEAKMIIKEFYHDMRGKYGQENEAPITPRSIEGISRLTEARARVRLSDIADDSDALNAIAMFKLWRYEAGGEDFDEIAIATGKTFSVRKADIELKNLLRTLSEGRIDVDISEVDILNGMSKLGFRDNETDDALQRLSAINMVYSPGAGRFRLVN